MRRTDAVFVAVCLALVAFAATYYLSPPAPKYYPLEGTWRMAQEKGKPSMGWYGRSAWGVGVACAAGALAAVLLRRVRRREGDPATSLPAWLVGLLTVVTLAALVALSLHVVFHEFSKWGTWGPWK